MHVTIWTKVACTVFFPLVIQYTQLDHCEEQMASVETFKQLADAKAGSMINDIPRLFLDVVKACSARNHKKRITSDEVIGYSSAAYMYIIIAAWSAIEETRHLITSLHYHLLMQAVSMWDRLN